MEKRYQIFISSTFTDLKDERAQLQKMIMQLDCIPAGMELFPAIDEEQLEFIKRIIDDSDYYVLIVGGRYGTVGKDGISYTEKEYDYAVSKGIKVIALLHEAPKTLPFDKSEKDAKARRSLDKFRKKASQGRMVLFWNDASELPGKIAQSLPVTIKTYPAVGWVRASSLPSEEIYKELNDLRRENDNLKQKLHEQGDFVKSHKIATLSDEMLVDVEFQHYAKSFKMETTWGELFFAAAQSIMSHASETTVSYVLGSHFAEQANMEELAKYASLSKENIVALRIQLRALDLINLEPGEEEWYSSTRKVLIWNLTVTGERLLLIERASRKVD